MNVCFARRPIAEVECRTPLRRRHHRVQIGCPGPGSGLVWDRTWRASGSGTGPKASGCTSSNPKKPRNPRSFVTSARCESRLACPSCTCLHTFVAHPRPDCGPGFGFSVRLRRTGCPKPAPEARPGCSVFTVCVHSFFFRHTICAKWSFEHSSFDVAAFLCCARGAPHVQHEAIANCPSTLSWRKNAKPRLSSDYAQC